MKKFFKVLGVVVLLIVAIFLLLGLAQSKDVSVVRTTTIIAPQNVVFDQIARFKNWPNWSPWVEVEPSVQLTYEGIDGQVGSNYAWQGDETGSGKMTNTGITGEQMNFELLFIKPWEGHSSGFLKAEAVNAQETKVTWSMTMHSEFPMNAFNFMTDKMIGKDFERGLELLKNYTEAHPQIELTSSHVIEKGFPATTFAIVRKTIPWGEMKKFSEDAFWMLTKESGSRIAGPPCTFYYAWDEAARTADMAPAFAVSGSEPVKGAEIVTIPAMRSCSILYKGGYAGLEKAQRILGEYIATHNKVLHYTYEEYLVGPGNEADSNKWATNVNFLVN
jgi:effector-binding domain-containing protein